jgi:hypothetical protein
MYIDENIVSGVVTAVAKGYNGLESVESQHPYFIFRAKMYSKQETSIKQAASRT